MSWRQSDPSHLSRVDTSAVGCWWQFFLQQYMMNIILLMSVKFPWKLVVPYPAIRKKWFWIFFWHLLTPESVWLLKGERLGYEVNKFLSSCWSHKSALACSWPEACVLPPPSAPEELECHIHRPCTRAVLQNLVTPLTFSSQHAATRWPLKETYSLQLTACPGEQKHVQCWTLQKDNTFSGFAGELMQAEPVAFAHIWVILP